MISAPSRLFRSVSPNTPSWAFMQPQWYTASARFTAAANRNLQLGLLGRKSCWESCRSELIPLLERAYCRKESEAGNSPPDTGGVDATSRRSAKPPLTERTG